MQGSQHCCNHDNTLPAGANGNGQPSLAAIFAALYDLQHALENPPDGHGPLPSRTHRLPFGRYAGVPLSRIPAGYLEWVLRTVNVGGELRSALAGELERREFPPFPPDVLPFVRKEGA